MANGAAHRPRYERHVHSQGYSELFIYHVYSLYLYMRWPAKPEKKTLYGIKFFCAFHFELHVCHSLDLIHPIHHRQSIDLIHKCISCSGQFFV